MRSDHKVTKDVFQPPKMFPTIRTAVKDKFRVIHAEKLPSFPHTFTTPSQPHSKMRVAR
jgi:hypothetical protein